MRFAIAGGLMIFLLGGYVHADQSPTFDFKIAPQALATALVEFSQQAEVQVVGATAAIGALRTDGVTGRFTGVEALERLLQGTQLAARWKGAHTVSIAPAIKASGTTPTHFDLQAKNLDQVLKDFELQSGLNVLAPAEVLAGKKGKSVHGDMTAGDALRRLLQGSGLTFVHGRDDRITILAVNAPGAVDAEGPVAADVSVQSQRVIQAYDPVQNADLVRTQDDVQPYIIFDSERIEATGATNFEDFLKQNLTQNTVAQTNSQQTGNPGGNPTSMGNTSTVNLLGLGADHTLVLVDGRRLAAPVGFNTSQSGGNLGQVDLNGIPLSAIDRIEVLPASAAAIYGASAVGGVVNVILKKNYSGGEVYASYTNFTQGNAPTRTLGASF